MRHIFILLAFLGISIASAVSIDDNLIAKSISVAGNEYLPVLIKVERPGIEGISAYARGLPMAERRAYAIPALKQISAIYQAPVLGEIYSLEKSGLVRDVEAIWLGGAIFFEARPSAIERICQIPGIEMIIDNSPSIIIEKIEDDLWRNRPAEPADAMEVTTAMNQVNAPAAWSAGYTGNMVIVAVLDSGVRYTHLDLADHMWINPREIAGNGIDDDMNGYNDDIHGFDFVNTDGDPWDDNSHGTSCAGLVAGDGTAASQTGVAPEAIIMALKVIDSGGSGVPSDVTYATQYAVEMGAHVLSISLGWEDPSNSVKDYYRGVFEDVLDAGVIAATSAGNGRSAGGHYPIPRDISAPADCPSPWQTGASSNTAIFAVGALNFAATDTADFSSRGPTSWNTETYTDFPYTPGLMKPEIAAPGRGVKTTSYNGDSNYNNFFSGTSASCPIVAGAMALVLSKNPSLSPEKVDSLLRATATDMGATGHDNLFGAGKLHCGNLIAATPLPTIPLLAVVGHLIDDATPVGNGSGVFDAGETVRLKIDVLNRGASATGVTVTAVAISNPHVSVIDALSSLGTIATGATANNSADPITIAAAIGTPPAFSAEIQLTTTTGAFTFVDTVKVNIGVYQRNFADHNTPTIATSVTNFGSFGYYDPAASEVSLMGQGFEYGDTNTLYGGGFFLATAYDTVYTGENGNSSEFLPIALLAPEVSSAETTYYTSYAVPGTGLRVQQKSTSLNSAPNENFTIMRFTVRNRGSVSYPAVYLGFYLDFDINAAYVSSVLTWFDRAKAEPANQWVYMWDESSTPRFTGYVGIVGLSGISQASVVKNADYVYPEGMGWVDTVKFNFMSGAFNATNGTPAGDWSVIVSRGPIPLSPGSEFTWAVAVVAGSNLVDFQTNAGTAQTIYSSMEVAERDLPSEMAISVSPNPFNSRCIIRTPGYSSAIDIFDLSGRVVNSLECGVSGERLWDGRTANGAELPSGVYFAKIRANNTAAKIVLLK